MLRDAPKGFVVFASRCQANFIKPHSFGLPRWNIVLLGRKREGDRCQIAAGLQPFSRIETLFPFPHELFASMTTVIDVAKIGTQTANWHVCCRLVGAVEC